MFYMNEVLEMRSGPDKRERRWRDGVTGKSERQMFAVERQGLSLWQTRQDVTRRGPGQAQLNTSHRMCSGHCFCKVSLSHACRGCKGPVDRAVNHRIGGKGGPSIPCSISRIHSSTLASQSRVTKAGLVNVPMRIWFAQVFMLVGYVPGMTDM